MLRRRVIPCLDVADGRVVKGTRFVDLVDEGDPPELAERYAREGADELVFLDITAAPERRGTLLEIVERTARRAFIPLTVGGGVRTVTEMRDVLRAGADKVSLNTAAVADPDLIARCADRFGRQAVVVAIDALAAGPGNWEVVVKGGRERTGLDAVDWAGRVVQLGAGELLVTSIDRDGTGSGFDTDLLRAISSSVEVPVIASGGAAGPADFVAAVRDGGADAVLAASIFHRRIHAIADVKAAMAAAGLPVRLPDGGRRVTSRVPPGVAFGPNGLVTAVVQDAADGRVLMVAHMDAEALAATLETGEVHFHSRSRDRLWRKGETSGNVLRLVDLATDCDGDALLVTVEPGGPTCHRGTRSCFDAEGAPPGRGDQGFAWLETLWATIQSRAGDRPEGSYTARLLAGGVDAAARKVTEEATEVLIAAKDDAAAEATGADRAATSGALAEETADLLYHMLVLLAERGATPGAALRVLSGRHRPRSDGILARGL